MSIENNQIFCKMIVIDTTTYAGNFEREMCAYLTGQVGDCEVGSELIEKAKKEIVNLSWWEENICPQEDQEGSEFFRPCSIFITPGINNLGKTVEEGKEARPPAYFSVAIFVEDFPPPEVLEEMMQRAKKFCENPSAIYQDISYKKSYFDVPCNLQMTGIRLVEPEVEKVLVEKEIVKNNQTVKKFKF